MRCEGFSSEHTRFLPMFYILLTDILNLSISGLTITCTTVSSDVGCIQGCIQITQNFTSVDTKRPIAERCFNNVIETITDVIT